MKYLIRVFVFNVFSLWLSSQLLPTIQVDSSWQAILSAGAILSVLMLVVKPILKILFLPINIITFGLLSWMVNVIVIYLLTVVSTGVRIVPWTFPGGTWAGFVVPSVHVTYLISIIVSSFLITFITNILHTVSET